MARICLSLIDLNGRRGTQHAFCPLTAISNQGKPDLRTGAVSKHAVCTCSTMSNVVVSMLLARHGETRDNAQGLILGRRDPPLSSAGQEQAARLAARVASEPVAAIWCSPLLRARQTATVVADAIGVAPTVLEDLIESDRGSWEGRPVAELAAVSPTLFAAFEAGDEGFVFPGGESIAQQVQRTRRALTVVAGGRIPALVVAHAGTIRAALIATGRKPPPERALHHGEAIPLRWPAPAAEAAGTGALPSD
jgi:broad specificity phosphatase PhoE